MPHDAVLLRIFTSTADRFGLEPLYQAIIDRARDEHRCGATELRGLMGFGQAATLHQPHLLPLHEDLPIVIAIVDAEEKIDAFLPKLDQIMESRLVTLEAAKVLLYGRQRTVFSNGSGRISAAIRLPPDRGANSPVAASQSRIAL
jgi:uncharacterized protein